MYGFHRDCEDGEGWEVTVAKGEYSSIIYHDPPLFAGGMGEENVCGGKKG